MALNTPPAAPKDGVSALGTQYRRWLAVALCIGLVVTFALAGATLGVLGGFFGAIGELGSLRDRNAALVARRAASRSSVSPGRTCAATSAMWTQSRICPGSCRALTASSSS